MKKTMLIMALCLSLGIVFTSCKGENKEKAAEEKTEAQDSTAANKADIAMNDVYQCPMDCEKGKTYDEEGQCPECKMDMKKVEKKEEMHEHEGGEKHEDHKDEKHTEGDADKKEDGHGHEH